MYDPVALMLAYTDQFVKTQPVALTVTSVDQKIVLGVDEQAPPMADASIAVDIHGMTEHLITGIGGAH